MANGISILSKLNLTETEFANLDSDTGTGLRDVAVEQITGDFYCLFSNRLTYYQKINSGQYKRISNTTISPYISGATLQLLCVSTNKKGEIFLGGYEIKSIGGISQTYSVIFQYDKDLNRLNAWQGDFFARIQGIDFDEATGDFVTFQRKTGTGAGYIFATLQPDLTGTTRTLTEFNITVSAFRAMVSKQQPFYMNTQVTGSTAVREFNPASATQVTQTTYTITGVARGLDDMGNMMAMGSK